MALKNCGLFKFLLIMFPQKHCAIFRLFSCENSDFVMRRKRFETSLAPWLGGIVSDKGILDYRFKSRQSLSFSAHSHCDALHR
jgi:hypothetical protein